ncbi:MAG TPA: DUF2069 domain-containing protein [Pseudomonadales bacterium]|jgi:uncharacterized membrane protein|nr:DUF2069 domain-containing protein [Pseudomonadales bacterium]
MNVQTALRMALLIWIGSLFALLGMQRFFAEPLATMVATIAVFVGQVAPLLVVTPAALRGGARGPLWICLAMLLYFVHGVWQWNSPNVRLFGILEVVFSLGTFVTAWILLKVLPRDSVSP